jgi:hypothetical protein
MMRLSLIAFLTAVAIMALLGATASLSSIPAHFVSREIEPEDFELSMFWLSLCSIVFAYCVFAVVDSARHRTPRIGVATRVVSAIVFVLGLFVVVVAAGSAPDRLLIVPGLLVALSPVAFILIKRSSKSVVPAA